MKPSFSNQKLLQILSKFTYFIKGSPFLCKVPLFQSDFLLPSMES